MKPTAILLLWEDAPYISRHVQFAVEREFDVCFMRYLSFGEKVNQDYLASVNADYLISFSPLIIKKHVLDSVRIAAVNFHPAPPAYPGRGGCSYALFNGDTEYGATAHLMTEKVDDGAILDVECFPIEPDETVESLQQKALAKIPVLVRRWLATKSTIPNGMVWNGRAKTQADFMEFMRISDPDEVERKIYACKHPTKPGPYVEVCGRKFWYIEGKP